MQSFFTCSISDSIDTSATDNDSMPRLEKQFVCYSGHTCLAVNLDYARHRDAEYGRQIDSGDELNSIIQTLNLSAGLQDASVKR